VTLSIPSENTEELLQTISGLHTFIDDVEASHRRHKHMIVTDKAIKQIGNGFAIERAMLTFGQIAVPSPPQVPPELNRHWCATNCGCKTKYLACGEDSFCKRVTKVHFRRLPSASDTRKGRQQHFIY